MKKKLGLFVLCFFLLSGLSARAEGPAVPAVAGSDKISLDIKGMDIIDVLKMLSSKTNINLAIDKNVSGRVTVFLKDVSPQQALAVVLASSGLVKQTQEGVTRIMTAQDYEQAHGCKFDDPKKITRIKLKYLRPQDVAAVLAQVKSNIGRIIVDDASGALILLDTEEKDAEMAKMIADMDVPQETAVFKFSYARCEKVADSLQDVITKGIASIKNDVRTNQLIITDRPEVIKRIRDMVKQLDERTREVLIEAKIIQVNLDDKTSFGIDWDYVLNKKLSVGAAFGDVISTTGNKWIIGSANPTQHNDYRALIEVLQGIGATRILSSPRLTVTNNESARILVGSKQVYVTTSAIQSQTTTETAEAVNFVDVGVKLYVTPSIGADGFISMKVRPEVSSVVQTYKTASGNTIPIVETSETETTVLLKDGSTLIIGGLIKEEKTKNINQIPILGDIPLLGHLFKNPVEEKSKTELAIFLTCHII